MKILLILLIVTSSFSFRRDGSTALNKGSNYSRKAFTGSSAWIDEDKDCQNTRAEVLIDEALGHYVNFRNGKRCVVDSGTWYDLYSNKVFYAANDMDIDHVVALKDAWESGAKDWPPFRRKLFANYMKDHYHLMAVAKGENRSKGAKGPDKYLPPNKSFVKEYCRRYIRIKLEWNLTMTKEQLIAVQKVLGDEIIMYPMVR